MLQLTGRQDYVDVSIYILNDSPVLWNKEAHFFVDSGAPLGYDAALLDQQFPMFRLPTVRQVPLIQCHSAISQT
jgi:hypothetical protein